MGFLRRRSRGPVTRPRRSRV